MQIICVLIFSITTKGSFECYLFSANEGHLYPLEKQFIFINKPAVLICFEDVESVDFQCYAEGQGSTHNFDLIVTLYNTPRDTPAVKEYIFTGIDTSNYSSLYSFLSQKKIHIKKIIEGIGMTEKGALVAQNRTGLATASGAPNGTAAVAAGYDEAKDTWVICKISYFFFNECS